MKNAKKLLALLTAVVLALALCVPTFAVAQADPVEAYTITAPDGDHTYEVYQIFTGDLSGDKTLSNIRWGTNGTGTTGTLVADSVLEDLVAVKDNTDNEKLAVITSYATLSSPVKTLSGTNLTYTTTPGYYLIKDKDNSITDPTGDNVDAYTTYVVVIVNDVAFTRKADVPEVEKKVNGVDVNNAAVGDTVSYTITGTLPTNIADFDTYFMEFTDTLSKGLTLATTEKTYGEGDGAQNVAVPAITVNVNGKDATKYFYIKATTVTAGTSIIVSIKDLLDLSDDTNIGAITKDTTVVVSYNATVNEDAVIDGNGNENDVQIKFSNDPNHSGTPDSDDNPPDEPDPYDPDNPTPPPTPTDLTGTTPKADTFTFVTKLTINKVDENLAPLPGAEFELTSTGALNTTKVVGTEFHKTPYTAQTGETILEGTYYLLTDGTYTTTAPSTEEGANNSKYASTTDKYVCVSFERWVNEGTTTGEPVKAFVDSTGTVSFSGIKAGTYTLTETTVPAGYNAIDPITITVAFDETAKEFYITSLMETKEVEDPEDNTKTITVNDTDTYTMTYQVVNKSGVILPETGGIGTTIFYVLGSILLLGAAVMLITKKRMGARG